MGMFTSGPINKEKESIQELYVGETKFIGEFIEQIGIARDKYVGKSIRPLNHDKNLIKIGDMLAEEFGFYSVSFTVLFDKMKNAFTYPITMTQEVSVNSLKPKFNKVKGYKYSNANKLCIMVCVTAGIWFDKNITNREIAAAIMHEIGHSFVTQSKRTIDILETSRLVVMSNIYYNIILHLCNPLTWQYVYQDIKNIKNTSVKGREIDKIARQKISDNPLFSGTANAIDFTIGIFKMITREIVSIIPLNKVLNNGIVIINGLVNKILLPLQKKEIAVSRSSEYLSDSFATMYGLGAEISSFLAKIDGASYTKVEELYNKIPIIGFLNATLDLPVLLLYNTIEAHPSTVARIEKTIKELKSELNNADVDDKLKVEIRKDIAEIEKVKENMLKPIDDKKYDAKMFRQLWNSYLNNKGDFENKLEKYYTDMDHRNKNMKESAGFLDNIELI